MQIEFYDKYTLEIDTSGDNVSYQFINPDGKKAKVFYDKRDPIGIGEKTSLGVEIRRHIEPAGELRTKGLVAKEFESIMIKLSEMVESIIIAKNEANDILKELEEDDRQGEIDAGNKLLEEISNPLDYISETIDWLTAGERLNVLYAWIAYCSQVILKNPISVIGTGEANSGKTLVQETALKLLPQEFVLSMKSSTMAAVYAMSERDPYYFDGKIINIGDMGGAEDHQEAQEFKNIMKEMQSDGYVKRIKQVKGEDGEYVNKEFELHGYPCLTYTNVPGYEYEPQEMSRSIFYQPRVDNDLAVSRMRAICRQKNTKSAKIIQGYHDRIPNIQRMVLALRDRMEKIDIENPYTSFIEDFLNGSKFLKRDVDKYDGILRVITAINGYNRELIDNTLFTTKNDIRYFIRLLQNYQESINKNLSPPAEKTLKDLRKHAEEWDLYDEGITTLDYIHKSGTSNNKKSVQNNFSELNSNGFIRVVGHEGRYNIYCLSRGRDESIMDEIELSDLDKRTLQFDYGLNNLDNYAIGEEEVLPDTLFKHIPLWNELLVEYKDDTNNCNCKSVLGRNSPRIIGHTRPQYII